ncbi:MAG TPA: hypothetical protein VL486_04390 [Verrucomicrobiae bacterium]|nr:hypothetical protein [Verrucomicrobiae bacterium]
MNGTKALVTLAIGDYYLQHWKRVCERNWRTYADRYGYDLICLDRLLDNSQRAKNRSPAWQKCLVLSQPFAERYERIVWVDSDVLINNLDAPSIVEGVPPEKVGAVETLAKDRWQTGDQLLDRVYEFYGSSLTNYSNRQYYTNYGLPDGFDRVVQTGVLVLSPKHHREMLEKVYYSYEEKGGREWHMEMRPLSYELLKADAVCWLDYRFNFMWPSMQFMCYPFLLRPRLGLGYGARIKRKLGMMMGFPGLDQLRAACLTAVFHNSFFMHFGGDCMVDMLLVNQDASSWFDYRF